MKNRTIIGIVCMILAVAVAFGVAPLINKTAMARVDVVCVAADIPQGRIIKEEDVKIVTVGDHNLSPKVIKDKTQVIGRFAVSDLKEDEMLMTDKITDNADGAESVFRTLDGDKKAMSISISSFAGGLSGKLQNGDIVSVIITNNGDTAIPAELKYVRVITVTSPNGNDAGEMDGESEMPSTVTLMVNDEQATILAANEVNGKLHISLVYRGDAKTAAKFLEAQETVFTAEQTETREEETQENE